MKLSIPTYDVPVEDIRRRLLESDARGAGARIMAIQEAVAAAYGMSTLQVFATARRTARVAIPRMLSMALCRELTDLSLADIAEMHGKRCHSTVIHARKKMRCAVAKITSQL